MEEAASASATVLDIKAPVFAAHKPVTSDITPRPAGSFRQRGFEVYVTTTGGCRHTGGFLGECGRSWVWLRCTLHVPQSCNRSYSMERRLIWWILASHLLQVPVFATGFLASVSSGSINEPRVCRNIRVNLRWLRSNIVLDIFKIYIHKPNLWWFCFDLWH